MDENNYELRDLWNVQLDILEKFMDVCEKYNLKWFAICGTLLGAVRHKGYIPWDDDLDVGMFPEDYSKFIEVAKKELRYPYCLQYYSTESYMTPWHAKIRRSDTTGCTKWEAEWMPESYNKGVFIDVFPLYSLPDDTNEKKKFLNRINKEYKVIASFQSYRTPAYLGTHKLKRYIKFNYYNWLIFLRGGYNKACNRYVKLCDSKRNEGVKVGLVSVFPGNQRFEFEKRIFDKTIKIQFEDILIVAPSEWDVFLTLCYGDYMTPVHGSQMHSGLVIDLSRSYVDYFCGLKQEV